MKTSPTVQLFAAGKGLRHLSPPRQRRRLALPDFYIDAHAAVRGYRLLTRDRARYATYFPKVGLIAPEQG